MKNKFTFLTRFSLAIAAMACFGQLNAQSNLSLTTVILTDSDDAEERGLNALSNPGLMDLGSSDIELVQDGNDGNQFIGLRFANLNLPKDAIIDSAFIQFTVDETNSGATTIVFKVEDADNSPTFTAATSNISSRAASSDSVIWSNIPAWGTRQVATPDQKAPDLSALLSRIIARPNWATGNPITFLITGVGERTAEAHNGTGAESAQLMVYYTAPVTSTFAIATGDDDAEQDAQSGAMDLSSSDLEFTTDGSSLQIIGMRFQNVNIPNGSVITDAHIQFQVDETNSTDTVNVAWAAEDTDNAIQYAATTNNLSGRTFMAAPTIQNLIPAWPTIGIAGVNQQTIGLVSQVQAVVNRAGWISGNAMAFAGVDPSVLSIPGYTSNAGKRTAESYNGSVSGAPRLVVTYIPPSTYVNGSFPVSKGNSWKFDDTGIDLTATNWTATNYSDSTWEFGDAVLGYNNGNEITTLSFGPSSTNKRVTTYLRYTFNTNNVNQYDSLIFDVLRDDGVIVYLNGSEIFRQNMPTGTIGFGSLASSVVGGADETTYFRSTVDNGLVNGLNVISVELHQQDTSSSDLSFDMEVSGKLPPLTTTSYPVSSGDKWNYLDNGTDLGATTWKDLNYNDTSWAYGASPLGYANISSTTLSYGPDINNKYITYYFRKRFNVANLAGLADSLILNLRRDDGAIVYVNGAEVIRSNMPAGAVNYRTNASSIISGADEQRFYGTTVSKSIFLQGDNIVAVELHQRDSSSSDLTFDFAIAEKPNARKACNGVNDQHISCFTSLFPTAQGPDFVIPNTHAFQVLIEQGDTYTNTGVRTTVPGNNDFTGYIGRIGSSEDEFLGINH